MTSPDPTTAHPTRIDRFHAWHIRHPERAILTALTVILIAVAIMMGVLGVRLWFLLAFTAATLVLVGGVTWLLLRLMRRRGLIPSTMSAEQVAQNRRVARAVRRGGPLPIDAAQRADLLTNAHRGVHTLKWVRWVFVGVVVVNALNGVLQAVDGSWVLAGLLFGSSVIVLVSLAMIPRQQRRYMAALEAHPDPPPTPQDAT